MNAFPKRPKLLSPRERELQQLRDEMVILKKYVEEEVCKNRETARAFMIRGGFMTKGGKLTKRYGG